MIGFSGSVCGRIAALATLIVATVSAAAAQARFPYDRELFLDSNPLPGSKRVPSLEIDAQGRVQFEFWCVSGEGQAEVTADTITITFSSARQAACTQDRLARDEALGAALSQVTQWRQRADVIEFVGPSPLRFRLPTH